MSQPPPIIPYSSGPTPLPPVRRVWSKFCVGIVVGAGVTLSAWMLTASTSFELVWLAISVPVVKVITGGVLCIYRDWRPLGLGLILSVPLSMLIFFVGCSILISR
jgi:hypothetical protein